MSEIFEIFDENNRLIGREQRDVVHSKGLYHRAVHILIFNSKGQMLIQRRMDNKDICPGKWDLSASEHLKPGESYKEAAERGLREELGISAKVEMLRGVHLQKNEYPDKGRKDYEFVEVWKAVFDGEIKADGVEVAEAKFIPMRKLKALLKEEPEDFTPWFREEMDFS